MSQTNRKAKRQYPSAKQKWRLVQLIKADPELRSGRFTATFTKKVANERWAKVALELNAICGAKKTGLGWRKTWIDMKSNSKKKNDPKRHKKPDTEIQPSTDIDDPILDSMTERWKDIQFDDPLLHVQTEETQILDDQKGGLGFLENVEIKGERRTTSPIAEEEFEFLYTGSPASPTLRETERALQEVERSRLRMEKQMAETSRQLVSVMGRFADAAESLSAAGCRLATVLENVGHALIQHFNRK